MSNVSVKMVKMEILCGKNRVIGHIGEKNGLQMMSKVFLVGKNSLKKNFQKRKQNLVQMDSFML